MAYAGSELVVLTEREVAKLKTQETISSIIPAKPTRAPSGRSYSQSGADGAPGASAPPINIKLNYYNNGGRPIIGITDLDRRLGPLYLRASADNALHLIARGGDGGDGGNGAPGREGRDGQDGRNATSSKYGTSGTAGEDGGPGGHGGDGGDAGAGGNISVYTTLADSDLLMLLGKIDCSAGQPGRPGSGGAGGKGGSGGRGGASYEGQKKVETWEHRGYDSTGLERSFGSVVRYEPYTVSGGMSGKDGKPGRDGYDGNPGRPAPAGSFKMIVNGTAYTQLYDLNIHTVVISSSHPTAFGVIEPGEDVHISQIRLINPSTMPTPAAPTQLRLVPSAKVKFNDADRVTLSESVAPGAIFELPKALKFRVAEQCNPPFESKLLDRKIPISYDLSLVRVKKSYASVSGQTSSFDVSYPAEMSLSSALRAITNNGEAPFAIELFNSSNLPLGAVSSTGRPLSIRVEAEPDTEISADDLLYKSDAGQERRLASSSTFTFSSLDPRKSAYLSGTIYTRPGFTRLGHIKLAAYLQLGSLTDFSKPKVIQKVSLNFQLTAALNFHPRTEFVLVINSQTTTAQIAHWRAFANRLGGEMSVWNATLYKGFSYTKPLPDGTNFAAKLKGKVVIFLDDEYLLEDNKTSRASYSISSREIFEAARREGVASYFVTNFPLELPKIMRPASGGENTEYASSEDYYAAKNKTEFALDELVADSADQITVKDTFRFWDPTEEYLRRKADEISRELRRRYPSECVTCFYKFEPKKLEGKHWQLGKVFVKRSLDAVSAKVGQRSNTSPVQGDLTDADIFGVLKLLPFSRKLDLIRTVLSNAGMADLLLKAILSDLTDEQIAFRARSWSGVLTNDVLPAKMIVLKTFASYDFTGLVASPQGKAFLTNLLLQLKLLAMKQPSFADKILPRRRKRIVTDITLKTVESLIKAYIDTPAAELQAQRRAIKAQFDSTHKTSGNRSRRRKLLVQVYSRPDSSLAFNTDKELVALSATTVNTEAEGDRPRIGTFTVVGAGFARFADASARGAAINKQKTTCDISQTPTVPLT